jgi:hypothetical protein
MPIIYNKIEYKYNFITLLYIRNMKLFIIILLINCVWAQDNPYNIVVSSNPFITIEQYTTNVINALHLFTFQTPIFT